jgi:hypothetical protein
LIGTEIVGYLKGLKDSRLKLWLILLRRINKPQAVMGEITWGRMDNLWDNSPYNL